jgi:uncharacterized protein YqhQ
MENKKTIELLQELVKKNPNDMELGKATRAFITDLEASKKEAEKQNKPKSND